MASKALLAVSPTEGVRPQMLREAVEMVRYALSSGISIPAALVQTVERYAVVPGVPGEDLVPLANAHERLSRLVAPATPRALVLFSEGETKRLKVFGPVRLVRQMTALAMGSMLVFILTSLTPWVSGEGVSMATSMGIPLLLNQLFWLAAAGIGASFAILFEVNNYIVQRSYDPKYETSYWVKFLIGVIAGFILVALVPVQAAASESAEHQLSAMLMQPTLAMLGGFSASAVYRILERLISLVESLFKGDPKAEAQLRERVAAQRAAEQSAQARMQVATQLIELQRQLAAGVPSAAVSERIGELMLALGGAGDSASQGVTAELSANPPTAAMTRAEAEEEPMKVEVLAIAPAQSAAG